MTTPILSIVVPTREGVSEHWIENLLKIQGAVEFILVHPPGLSQYSIDDTRLKQINSSFRGEIMQRMTGLLNASGTYSLTMNCDEYVSPDIADITAQYFERFPDSWVMRLATKSFQFGDKAELEKPWTVLPQINQLKICGKSQGNHNLSGQPDYMLEIPIAPLLNKFDIFVLFRGRRDLHGPHTENFDKKVWSTKMVKESLQDLINVMGIIGPIKYVPFWCLDRLLGLFIQAKFFENGKIIGHVLPKPEQIRSEDNPPEFSRNNRFYGMAEILLIRQFPQYGYFWNLMIHHFLRDFPLNLLRSLRDYLKSNPKPTKT